MRGRVGSDHRFRHVGKKTMRPVGLAALKHIAPCAWEIPRSFRNDMRVAARLFASREMVEDRKSTRLNSSHVAISYAVFCLKKKKKTIQYLTLKKKKKEKKEK